MRGYILKDALLNAAAAVATNLDVSTRIAAHLAPENTRKYTQATSIGDVLLITSKLVVPGVAARFGDYNQAQLLAYLNSLRREGVRYVEFKVDWGTSSTLAFIPYTLPISSTAT